MFASSSLFAAVFVGIRVCKRAYSEPVPKPGNRGGVAAVRASSVKIPWGAWLNYVPDPCGCCRPAREWKM